MQTIWRGPEGLPTADPATFPCKSFSEHGYGSAPATVGAGSTHHRHNGLSRAPKRSKPAPDKQIGVLPEKIRSSWDASFPSDASNSASFKEKIYSFASLEAVQEEENEHTNATGRPRGGLTGFLEKLGHPEAPLRLLKKRHPVTRGESGPEEVFCLRRCARNSRCHQDNRRRQGSLQTHPAKADAHASTLAADSVSGARGGESSWPTGGHDREHDAAESPKPASWLSSN